MTFDLGFLVDNGIFNNSYVVGHEDLDEVATARIVIGLIACLNEPSYQKDPARFVNNMISTRSKFTIDLIKDSINQVLYDHKQLFQKKMKELKKVKNDDEPKQIQRSR